MDLEYRPPAACLRDFVSVYYIFHSAQPVADDHERAAVAQVRRVFNGDGTITFIDGRTISPDPYFVIGPTTGHVQIHLNGPFTMFGIGLLPAGWVELTGRDASEFVDNIAGIDIMPPAIEALLASLDPAMSIDRMTAHCNAALEAAFAPARPETVAFVRRINQWLESSVSPELPQLLDEMNLSDRQLARKVKYHFGIPPKFLARKYRALRAARLLIDADEDEADYLRDAFYDQSHMIREIKLFAGVTPKKLRKEEGEVASLMDKRAELADDIDPLVAGT